MAGLIRILTGIVEALMESLGPLGGWIKSLFTWLNKNPIAVWLSMQVSEGGVKATVTVGIQFLALAAYGVFLLVFWTWISGTSFHEIFSANPLTGAPAGVLYLVSHAFPLKFLFGSFFAYIHWRLTVIPAAIVFSRVIKATPGA